MRKVLYLSILLVLVRPFSVLAQQGGARNSTLEQEKVKLFQMINAASNDTIITDGLSRIIASKLANIHESIESDGRLSLLDKEKAVRSLVYFVKEVNENITERQLEMYDIPAALDSYQNILTAILHHQPFAPLLMPLAPRRCQLLASAFSQYNGYALLDDIAVYKRVAASPEFILRFLQSKPGYRFADSLLLVAAANDPLKIVSCLNGSAPGLQEKIRRSGNIYVQQIVSLSGNREASEVLPFITQIARNELTPEEILEKRLDVVQYFQLLVNQLIGSRELNNPSFIFQKTLRNGIKQKALSFFAKQINELHTAPDAVRFASVKDLRAEDIYYVITSCGEELYTSSYLGLYKRLMDRLKNQSADSIFNLVQYDNFRTFIRLAANYNVIANFLTNMPADNATVLLKRFIDGVEVNTSNGLDRAMDIADCFTGIDSSEEMAGFIRQELQNNLDRCHASQQYFGIRLYSILLQVFDQVKQNGDNKLWRELGNYEMLPRKELQNKNGEINELVLFYGDEDGMASFNSFQKLFSNNSKWTIIKNDSWITIHSVSDEPITVYANLPLDSKEDMDIKAQDSLVAFLEAQSIEPSILIHRGHSYHLCKTLQRLNPSTRLAILGSCGGYNSAISIATINPDAQIIGSKKTGSKSINDPIIDVINTTLLSKEDLFWPEIWSKLRARFRKDESALSLFDEYIPPGKNLSLFVLKLFNYYNKPSSLAVSQHLDQ